MVSIQLELQDDVRQKPKEIDEDSFFDSSDMEGLIDYEVEGCRSFLINALKNPYGEKGVK